MNQDLTLRPRGESIEAGGEKKCLGIMELEADPGGLIGEERDPEDEIRGGFDENGVGCAAFEDELEVS